MQEIIDRLTSILGEIEPPDEELFTIIEQLKTLNQEHTRQTDELRTLRGTTEQVSRVIMQARRQYNIWQDELNSLEDEVAIIVTYLGGSLSAATDDAAALRGTLEGIRDMARKAENDDGDRDDYHRELYIRDLLGSVSHRAVQGLKEHQSGAALRKDISQLQINIAAFEKGVSETSGFYYSDRTLADRVQRCIDHYTRMAAQAVSDSHGFRDATVSWMRAIAINAQAVSWASTHAEKDARLRGLIEVIETAISKIDERRFDDRLSRWNGVVDSWMKSDFPTREMRRRIFELEDEIKRMSGKEPQAAMQVESPVEDSF